MEGTLGLFVPGEVVGVIGHVPVPNVFAVSRDSSPRPARGAVSVADVRTMMLANSHPTPHALSPWPLVGTPPPSLWRAQVCIHIHQGHHPRWQPALRLHGDLCSSSQHE